MSKNPDNGDTCEKCRIKYCFKDKVVFITGATKGIGKSIAMNFAREGAKLVLIARNMTALIELKAELSIQYGTLCNDCIRCDTVTGSMPANNFIVTMGDVSSEKDMIDAISLAVDSFGHVDVLVHNAGVYPSTRFEDMTLNDWTQVIDINLTGTFIVVKSCVDVMKQQLNGGKVVLVSSISGPRTGLPGFAHYTASKGGMNGFMKTIAIEMAKYHININAVEPGNILTEGYDVLDVEHVGNMLKAVPLGRLGQPQDIASAVLFLASEDANYITGQSLIVDGGQTLPESHHLQY